MSHQIDNLVDVHTHLFNARSIPVSQILNITYGISKLLANPFGRLIVLLSDAPSFGAETPAEGPSGRLVRLLSVDGKGDVPKRRDDLAAYLNDRAAELLAANLTLAVKRHAVEARTLEDLQDVVMEDPLHQTLVEIEGLYFQDNPTLLLAGPRHPLADIHGGIGATSPYQASFERVESYSRDRFGKPLRWLLDKILSTLKILDPLEFFFLLLLREDLIWELFLRNGYPEVPSTLFVHHMMDMQYSYSPKDPPMHAFFPDQVDRMRSIERNSRGHLLGFVNYNPRRPNAFNHVLKALDDGAAGIKIYPGLDYLPQDCQVMLDHCCSKDLPIMAHCTPFGWEVTRGKSGLNSDPDNWRAYLEQDPSQAEKRKSLRLCLGHAGGEGNAGEGLPGWLDPWDWNQLPPVSGGDNYAIKVFRLCTEYENVFCDFSYHDYLVTTVAQDDLEAKITALKTNLITAIQNTEGNSNPDTRFHRKIMYGTDFHMPSLIHRTQDYLNVWLEIFRDPRLAPYAAGFFGDNARRFLRIGN